jgi:hypothetical protein
VRKIVVELSTASCKAAIDALKEYEKNIKPKMDEVCKRLAEIGAQEANAHLTLANGNNDATITVEKMDGGYKLVMSGSDVYFIEFGTGSDTEPHYQTSVPVFAGSWSMEHSQRYAKSGWWWYNGEIYVGTPAYMPMYYAEKKMREEMPRIVREVFGQ